MFVVPWGDTTYIGTTDTDYDGPLDDPPCTAADVDYLLARDQRRHRRASSPRPTWSGTWAGLRPLLRKGRGTRTADLSRRHSVRTAPSGVVTVTGGKLTTYRRMAADAVDAAARRCSASGGRPSRTKHLRLFGGEGMAPPVAALEPSAHEHLTGRYGTEAEVVLALVADEPDLGDAARARPALPPAEALYAVRHEMARTLDDVLARRTRARLLAATRRPPRPRRRRAARARARLVGAERDAQVAGVPGVDRHRAATAVSDAVSPLRGTVAEVPAAVLDQLGGDLPGRPHPRRWPPPAATGGRWP